MTDNNNNNSGELQIYNPDKQISEQITLKRIVEHDVSMNLARTGLPDLPSEKPLSFNQRIILRYKGLNQVISAQQCLITNAKPIVRINNLNKWKKKNKEQQDKEKNPFKEEDNDYNELMAVLSFLDECEQKIITARKTKKFDDDFVWEKEDQKGDLLLELSPNFFSMIKELEEYYEVIYGIMSEHKIVSSGLTIDEEMNDKAIEEEMLRRITES